MVLLDLDGAVGPYYGIVCITTVVGKYEDPLEIGSSATLQSLSLVCALTILPRQAPDKR